VIEKVHINENIEIAYRFIGEQNAQRPLLLFLHEGMGCIERFNNFPERLCYTLNAAGLVYDRYGYGYSTPLIEKRNASYLHREAEYFLPLLLDQLVPKTQPLILIGHSDGASIALLFASIYPDRVKYIVSMAAHVFVEDISIRNVSLLEKNFFENTEFRKKIEKYHFDHTESTLLAFTQTITSPEFKSWNIENSLRKIKCPILIMQGDLDQYGTQKQVDSISLHSKNKQNKTVIIKNCGHSPHLEKQEEVIKLIYDFSLRLH
jgi:pimeloyl-ACP methyl ester carboxylesterase